MGIAALVLGIVSLLICWIPCINWFALIPAIVGIILGIIDIVKKSKAGEKKAISIVGLILSIVAVVVTVVWTIVLGVIGAGTAASSSASTLKSFNEIENSLSTFDYNYDYDF